MKSESEVAQSCPTLRNAMDCSLPGSSVHGIFQARVLEWVAIAFPKNPMSGMKRQPHKRVNYEVDGDDFFFTSGKLKEI